MVAAEAIKVVAFPKTIKSDDMPEEELRWCSVSLNEVLERGSRLEASVFDIEGKLAIETVKQCKWAITRIAGKEGISTAFYPTRFKRIMVDYSEYTLILPSQIQEINPLPKGYLSPICHTDFELLKGRKGQILMTRSGTIGNCSLVSETLDGKTLSDDIIRITCKDYSDTGYLYAFLRTKIGNTLIRTNEYGAVVSHIEPEHLETIPIPNPPELLKRRIHDLIIRAYDLRDESNVLLDKAETLLIESLNLPPIEKLRPRYFLKTENLRNYTVKLSQLAGRFDASYHVPIVKTITNLLKKGAAEVTVIGDPRISKHLILPCHFKRIYVNEGQGVPLLGGKQIYQIDPSGKKYLALSRYGETLRQQIILRENMIMITAKGTPGKTALVPKHWAGWVMSSNIISITPSSTSVAGYLYVFLSTLYGKELLTRNIYGAVVDIMEPCHLKGVPVPLLKDAALQEKINRLALQANAKRTESYYMEQEAIRITNDEVIHRT